MSQMCAPGWLKERNNSCIPTQQIGSPPEARNECPLEKDHLAASGQKVGSAPDWVARAESKAT